MGPSEGSPQAWRSAGRTFSFKGHEIFFRDDAGGPGTTGVLLLIHGYPTSSWDWHKLWPSLTAKFARVVAPDMLGFGFSAKPRRHAYTLIEQAELHEVLLEQLGEPRVHILAHDYGDSVAQELLARHLERRGAGLQILSCTLLNGGLFPETHRARRVQKLLLSPLGPVLSLLMNRRAFARSFAAVFGANSKPSERELDEFWNVIEHDGGQRVMHRLIRYMPERRQQRERWVGALQQTRVPLCLINGPDDPISGAHMVARYRELVGKGEVVSLPGIGHYPQTEDPAGVVRAFSAFHARLP